MYENINSSVVGMKLSNGKVQVVKSSVGSQGVVFESVSSFESAFSGRVDESTGSPVSYTLIESING